MGSGLLWFFFFFFFPGGGGGGGAAAKVWALIWGWGLGLTFGGFGVAQGLGFLRLVLGTGFLGLLSLGVRVSMLFGLGLGEALNLKPPNPKSLSV